MILARAAEASRRYGDTLALDRVSLDVTAGQLVGLLGPNGAGKSTLVHLLTGIRRPSSGRVELCGGDPRLPAARRHLGVTPQETGLPASLRVGEVVDFVRAHYPDPLPRGELLDRFGLSDLVRRQTGGLSGAPLLAPSTAILKAMRKRVGANLVLVGAGGIASGADAYAKIRAGASLVQLYSALVYEGPGLVTRIKSELAECLARDGYDTVTEAVGVDA